MTTNTEWCLIHEKKKKNLTESVKTIHETALESGWIRLCRWIIQTHCWVHNYKSEKNKIKHYLKIWCSHFIFGGNSYYQLTINCDFCLDKFLICCLLIVSKIVVKFRYGVGLRDLKYGHANLGITVCFISTNKQPICQ